jgi:hypothetical protein
MVNLFLVPEDSQGMTAACGIQVGVAFRNFLRTV